MKVCFRAIEVSSKKESYKKGPFFQDHMDKKLNLVVLASSFRVDRAI